MPDGEVVLSNEEIARQIAAAGEKQRVSPLDPDFLIFILPFALVMDLTDIVLELTSFLVLPKIIGVGMDIITFAVIGGWIFWRVGRIVKSKKEQQKALEKAIAKRGTAFEKQLAKGLKSPLRRAGLRAGIAVLGEIALFVGLLPFWTISVVLTLREK